MAGPEMEKDPEQELSDAEEIYKLEVQSLPGVEFHRRVAESVCKSSGKSPEEKARFFSEQGLPYHVLDYLELSELSQPEKNQVLALAYERQSKRQKELTKRFPRAGYDLDAKASEKKAQILKGETEATK